MNKYIKAGLITIGVVWMCAGLVAIFKLMILYPKVPGILMVTAVVILLYKLVLSSIK